jgi:hypothetical protein
VRLRLKVEIAVGTWWGFDFAGLFVCLIRRGWVLRGMWREDKEMRRWGEESSKWALREKVVWRHLEC